MNTIKKHSIRGPFEHGERFDISFPSGSKVVGFELNNMAMPEVLEVFVAQGAEDTAWTTRVAYEILIEGCDFKEWSVEFLSVPRVSSSFQSKRMFLRLDETTTEQAKGGQS